MPVPTFLCDLPKMTDSVRLDFSSGRTCLTSLALINQELMKIGVRVSFVPLVNESLQLLAASVEDGCSAISQGQKKDLLKFYELDRDALLEQIALAGRRPACSEGGELVTAEKGVPPYPKIYDLKAMGAQGQVEAQFKFGRFHFNSSPQGVGVDEVMTLISGGPWTWFFANVKEGEMMKLTLGYVTLSTGGIRLSYPGINPHGAFMRRMPMSNGLEGGLCVAQIHGPHEWLMQYADVGENPWCDFSDTSRPLLL